MPAQFAPFFAATAIAICAVLDLSAAATIAQSDMAISANAVLRAWCVIGAVIGGTLAVLIWAPEDPASKIGFRMVLVKFLAATLLGIMCGPVACRYTDAPINEDWVMFVAGSIAFSGVPVIHKTAPIIGKLWEKFVERWITKKADDYFGSDK